MLPGATLLMQPPYPDGIDPATVAGPPTMAEVLARLPGSAIAHFACHGMTDPADPSQSGLLLAGHQAAPLTVASLAPVRLDAARLAYLSACSTALNEATELADESIHLTSAFQLAGFPHVVGTLWEVDEYVADVIAKEFYSRLAAGTAVVDLGRTAETLHHIVRELRDDEPHAPFTWAAYLHAGA
jgi:CHAT domain-containing protein